MQHACDLLARLQEAQVFSFFKTLFLIAAGFLFARVIKNSSKKLIGKYASSQQSMVIQKILYFSVLIIFLGAALQQLGFKLSVLLGSAGIITAAIAIASQASISNVISGLFLIMEKSFQIGDKIKIGTTTGTVTAIDLLSVKIVTSNNTLVRIPSESLIKSEITNLTRFDSRRLDLVVIISNEENILKIKELLVEVALNNKYVMKTPQPTIMIQAIDSTDVTLQLSAWSNQNNYDSLKDSLYQDILLVFKQHNVSL